jgi:hypothetical protein
LAEDSQSDRSSRRQLGVAVILEGLEEFGDRNELDRDFGKVFTVGLSDLLCKLGEE